MIFSEKISLFEKKLSEFIGKPKDLRKALRSLGLPNKISSCEVSALKINNTVEHDANSILESFKIYYSTLAVTLVNMPTTAPNKYSVNTVIKYYEYVIQDTHFNLASVSKNLILTILKSTQLSKAAGLDSLSGRFPENGAKFLAKPIKDLCNLSINPEKFPDICKVAKLRPLYRKGSLTQPCNYRPISLLTVISKVMEEVIHYQTSTFLDSKNLLYTYQ